MCGIVGYTGKRNAADILLNGLKCLEYRGYDSAGIAVQEASGIKVIKEAGKLQNLRMAVAADKPCGSTGIGHTRWATHGAPTIINAHPHTSGSIAVVHNGIIENYEEIKNFLTENGYTFLSDTDTEVIPNLVDFYYDGDLLAAVKRASKRLCGSYALGVISSEEQGRLIAVRHESPLVVGTSHGENFIASDIPAILSETSNIYLLDDNEFADITENGISISDINGNIINKQIYVVDFTADAARKCGYKHFMLKEIHEQPEAIRNTVRGRIAADGKALFDELPPDVIKNTDRIYIAACGTAYHASLIGKKAIERLAGIPVTAEPASEIRYGNPLITDKTLFIIISQSGETADTLAALRDAKKKGAVTLAITNVVGSSAARESDYVFFTNAGPEIAVASTKAYTTQLVALYLFAVFAAQVTGYSAVGELERIMRGIAALPEKAKKVLDNENQIRELAGRIHSVSDVYFIGRGQDYPGALEAALKLKEVSYIHADAYFGGELKHGPIALIDRGTVVISLATDSALCKKTESNIKEVTARGAYTIGFWGGSAEGAVICHENVILPETEDILAPAVSIIPLQMLAYYVADLRGCDVDKPRNLVKSVTVE